MAPNWSDSANGFEQDVWMTRDWSTSPPCRTSNLISAGNVDPSFSAMPTRSPMDTDSVDGEADIELASFVITICTGSSSHGSPVHSTLSSCQFDVMSQRSPVYLNVSCAGFPWIQDATGSFCGDPSRLTT